MAYFMHVHWDWIKQRPHFLYEELTKYFNVDLFFIDPILNRKNNVTKNSRLTYSESSIYGLTKLPYSSKFEFLRYLERMLNNRKIQDCYQYIWITSPIILQFLPRERLNNKMVIYDCMDNFLEFSSIKRKINKYYKLESELIKHSNFIFTSSQTLKEELLRNYQSALQVEPVCVNNGISSALVEKFSTVNHTEKKEIFNLTYIGTISDWFDIELIYLVLDKFEDIKVTLVGPIEISLASHPRLEITGPVVHEELHIYAQKSDAFIMPFILNDLILSVDPVKIYEYMLFSKPIISINYREMGKFKPFVHLYKDYDEALSVIQNVKDKRHDNNFTKEEVINFLSKNTWGNRARQISNILL